MISLNKKFYIIIIWIIAIIILCNCTSDNKISNDENLQSELPELASSINYDNNGVPLIDVYIKEEEKVETPEEPKEEDVSRSA